MLFDRIQLVKDSQKITIRAIEDGSGLPAGTIKKWKTSIPSGETILKVANYLDVSVDYLLGNTDNPMSHRGSAEVLSAISQLAQVLTEFEDAAHAASSKVQAIETQLDLNKVNHMSSLSMPKEDKAEELAICNEADKK